MKFRDKPIDAFASMRKPTPLSSRDSAKPDSQTIVLAVNALAARFAQRKKSMAAKTSDIPTACGPKTLREINEANENFYRRGKR